MVGLFGLHQNTSSGLTRFSGGPQLDPLQREKTEAERLAFRKKGVADTTQNTGSLAVQYRGDEETAREAGEQSVGDKEAQKSIDTRIAAKKNKARAKAAFANSRSGHAKGLEGHFSSFTGNVNTNNPWTGSVGSGSRGLL